MQREIHDFEFFNDTGRNGPSENMTGTLVFEVDFTRADESDIGGIDGWQITECEFMGLRIGGKLVTPDDLEGYFGRSEVKAAEEYGLQILADECATGEWADAA